MKLIRVTLMFLLIITSISYSKDDHYFESNAKQYNSVWEKFFDEDLDYRFDINNNRVDLYFSDGFTTVALELTEEDRQNLQMMIDKYFKWRAKALEMEVELHKEIATSKIKAWFKFGDDWYRSCGKNVRLLSTFFSQSIKRHQLILSFGKIYDCDNEYIHHRPDKLYFDYEDVLALQKGLDEKTLTDFKQVLREKEEIDKQFE